MKDEQQKLDAEEAAVKDNLETIEEKLAAWEESRVNGTLSADMPEAFKEEWPKAVRQIGDLYKASNDPIMRAFLMASIQVLLDGPTAMLAFNHSVLGAVGNVKRAIGQLLEGGSWG